MYTYLSINRNGQIWMTDLLNADAEENERNQHPKLDLILKGVFNI